MPFPPQQADEHCKGTGQGELKLKLNLSWNWIRITLISCNHFEFNAQVCKHELQEIENCPDCYLNAHVKVNPMEKNTRSFGHCQNYYINRKDLSLSLWSNDQLITMVNFLERHLVHRGLPVPPSCGMGQVIFHESCFIIMIIIIMGQEIIRSFILLQFTL